MREQTVPYRERHMHSCEHTDDCYLEREVAAAEPCRECRAAAFNRKQAAKASKPALLFRAGDTAGLVW